MVNINKTYVVLGTQFGDEGKGMTTDWLCSQAKTPIVVRFSGGQQAGHTVIYNGVKHIHSSFGSGTLRGVPTYFTEDTTFYLPNMLNELHVLKSKNITPDLYLHPLVKATSPYDIAYNKAKEKINQHGSCGIGVGATMERNINSGYKLHAIDFTNYQILKQKLEQIKIYYDTLLAKNNELNSTYNEFLTPELDYFNECLEIKLPFEVNGYNILKTYSDLIFEGSQGILLDMDHGIFPNVTYSNTTSKNAIKICKLLNTQTPEIYYVTRCYQTRHGNGWMSNENKIDLVNNHEEINVFNEWQRNFRIGEFDYELLKYACSVDNIYSEDIDPMSKHLVVTCIDQRPDFVLNMDILQNFGVCYTNHSAESGHFKHHAGHLDAVDQAYKMIKMDEKHLPRDAYAYFIHLSSDYDYNPRKTLLTACIRYNQAVLGMSCSDKNFIIPKSGLKWFEKNGILCDKLKKNQ